MRQHNKELKEWFYPRAKRLSSVLSTDGVEKEWEGRIPILVEDAWAYQQNKIDVLEACLSIKETNESMVTNLIRVLDKYKGGTK